jgi:glycosyltransferase involved in cell wall biosynthesis
MGSSMNILCLDATRGLYGASRALLTLLEHLDRARYRPYAVLSDDVDDGDLRLPVALAALGVAHEERTLAVLRRKKYLNPGGALFLAGALAGSTGYLRGLIRRRGVDIVQTNTSTILSGAAAAALTGRPHIWHLHEILGGAEAAILGRIMRTPASTIVANSEASARALGRALPGLTGRITVIRNGIDPRPFQEAPPERVAQARAAWGAGPGDLLVGMVGRLGTWKGEEQFVAVAAQVRRQAPNARFVIVGSAFDGQEAPVARLQAQIAAAGLGGEVRLAGLRADIPVVMNALDALAHLPARPEPFGLVVAEAMAAGKPVVAAAVGGLPEIIRDGQTGFLAPPGGVDAAAGRLALLLRDPALRARMGEAGRQRIETEFSAEQQARRFEALYRRIAARQGRR